MIKRLIPSSDESLPVIGLGTWQTFDLAGRDTAHLTGVLEELYRGGGRLIDSSPMYGRSEETIGELTSAMNERDDFFYATKVWTQGGEEGIAQMASSMQKMHRKTMDLMQIHNLKDWKTHLPQLRAWKESGRIRYIGITHYTDSSHDELERIVKAERPDFVQFNYSILARHAEKRLLPVAAEYGAATLINRPFGEGSLFKKIAGKPLPSWASEFDMDSWSVFVLKYIISHPVVTCVIPATADPLHAADNMRAGIGKLPDESTRKKMVAYLETL